MPRAKLRAFRDDPKLPLNDNALARVRARAVTDDESLMIYTLIQAHRIDRVVECGTANGYSTCWLALALLDMQRGEPEVHTWDVEDRPKTWDVEEVNHGREEFQKNYKDIITFHHSSFSDTLLDTFTPDENKRTAYFIDGDHSKGMFARDWKTVEPLLNKGDLVIFHDALGYAWINRKVFNLINEEAGTKYDGMVLTSERGVGVIWLL
jgi:predicted O-methyltransferase YrrM